MKNKTYTIQVKEVNSKDKEDSKKKVESKKAPFSWMILIFAVIVAIIISPVELNTTSNYITPNKPKIENNIGD